MIGAGDQRYDLSGRRTGVEPERSRGETEPLGETSHMGALSIERGNEVESGVDRTKNRRRQRGRVNQPGTAVDQVLAQGRGAGDIGTEAAKRLGKRTDDNIRLA